jgi:hypothetical protein
VSAVVGTVFVAIFGYLITFYQQQSSDCQVASMRAFIVANNADQKSMETQLDALTLQINEVTGLGPKPSDHPEEWARIMGVVLESKREGLDALARGIDAHQLALVDCSSTETISLLVVLNAAIAALLAWMAFDTGRSEGKVGKVLPNKRAKRQTRV